MWRKRMFQFMIVIILCMLTGCWSSRELNEIAITYGFGIDKIDGEYIITAQVINPEQVANKKTAGTGSPVVLYEGKDRTLLNAIRKTSLISPRKLYGGHLYTLIISEDVAREGLSGTLDLFTRDQELRSDFLVVIAKDHTAKEILSVLTPFLVAPTQEIFEQLEFADKQWDPSKATTIRELITKISAEGINPVVPGILPGESKAGQSETNRKTPQPPLPTSDLAVFYKDQLKGWLREEEARTFNTLTNNIKNSVTGFPCSRGGYGVMESGDVKTKFSPTFLNNKPVMNVQISFKGRIAELDCNQKVTSRKDFSKLDQQIEKYLQTYFSTQTKNIQQNIGVDIFGFGQEFYRKHPDEWKRIKGNWDEIFTELPVNIQVNVELKDAGTIGNPLKEKIQGAK